MNAVPLRIRDTYNLLVDSLYAEIKGLNINKVCEVCLTHYVIEDEINEYLYASAILRDVGIIESNICVSSGKKSEEKRDEDVEINEDEIQHNPQIKPDGEVYFYKYIYKLKPKVLIDHLIDISRIPKYSLNMGIDRKVVLNGLYLLNKTHPNSVNYYFINYCIKNRKGKITDEILKKKAGAKIPRFHTILQSLNIAPTFTDIFFKDVGKCTAEFKMDVTNKDLHNLNIDEKKVGRFLKTLKKVRIK